MPAPQQIPLYPPSSSPSVPFAVLLSFPLPPSSGAFLPSSSLYAYLKRCVSSYEICDSRSPVNFLGQCGLIYKGVVATHRTICSKGHLIVFLFYHSQIIHIYIPLKLLSTFTFIAIKLFTFTFAGMVVDSENAVARH